MGLCILLFYAALQDYILGNAYNGKCIYTSVITGVAVINKNTPVYIKTAEKQRTGMYLFMFSYKQPHEN